MQGLVGYNKGFEFYFKFNGKPLEGFNHANSMMIYA